jgi:hypothetical protein
MDSKFSKEEVIVKGDFEERKEQMESLEEQHVREIVYFAS